MEFIDKNENIILIGNPGTGKTHFSIGIGIQACIEGYQVLFTSVPNLVLEMKEAMSQNALTKFKKKFEKYDVTICDELGYTSFDKSGSELLFNLLSNQNEKGSILITTNLTFERWNEMFDDPTLTGATVDRLAYCAHVIDMRGESYRIRQTKSWLEGEEGNEK